MKLLLAYLIYRNQVWTKSAVNSSFFTLHSNQTSSPKESISGKYSAQNSSLCVAS